jgi:CheY-like chemotaxis protein
MRAAILLAEDEPVLRRAMTAFLEDGFTVEDVASGEAALDLLENLQV